MCRMTKGPMNVKARPRVERRYKHKGSKQQKHIYPDDELEFVMERGGPGIDSELVLGTGTDKLIVAPMRPGETLLQVVSGKTESYATTFTGTAKKIAVRRRRSNRFQFVMTTRIPCRVYFGDHFAGTR